MNDLIIQNISELILPKKSATPLKGAEFGELKIVKNGTVVINDGKIVYVGEFTEEYSAQETIDGTNKTVSPALVDAHTHLVHGGSREHEMSLKRQGVSYLEILEQGGGIHSTVQATRVASEDELFEKAEHELLRMMHHGVLSVESKSGYGLSLEHELKQLRVSKRLEEKYGINMKHTYLGPHAVPKDTDSEAFIEECINDLEYVKELADFADIFCETGVFTIEQSRKYMQAAKAVGLPVKIHADEIDPLGGLELAIEEEAISADHLVAASNKGKAMLRESNTVAVLLPGTTFYLDKNEYADARGMIENNGAIAIATDYNPGSCVTSNLQMVMSIAALKLKLSPKEIWNAVTVNAAKAIGLDAGTLEAGDEANLVVWRALNHEYVPYHYGVNHAEKVIHKGKVIVDNQFILK
ncbi:imidazolonepropionase [Macrococcoides caseolyticum]|uniref:imidazolonepropionase n=1 Tax=Macrococcoides caseolyticum TaxID=69966 RepID=UPI001F46C261|nr:imidazolonepropionase [Macrococcus caseolyticus]MCE4956409.1 imidazolonepropionase [Macrococcus caseolyticus]